VLREGRESHRAAVRAPPLKVMHILKVNGVGGAERHLLALLPALRECGVDASVLLLDAGGDSRRFRDELDECGVPWRAVRCGLDLSPRLAWNVLGAVRAERPDLMHTHMVHGDFYGSLAAHALRVPFVSSRHNDDRYLLGSFRHVNRAILHGAGRLIVASDTLAELMARLGVPGERIVTIPYGLDEPPARPSELTPSEARVPDGVPLILAIGRFVEQKDHATLLHAFCRVRQANPTARLAILGSGPLEPSLRAQAASLGLDDSLVAPGRVEPRDWLARADIFVHTPRWEGFGMVLLEAMLAELPVVATRVSAIPEIVVDGKTGYLARAGDAKGLATAVSTVLSKPRLGRRLGRAGLKRARSVFPVMRMVEATVGAYLNTLA